jgi:hypothetical protein
MRKYLRLDEQDVDLVVTAINASRISNYTPEQRVRLAGLQGRLSRYHVASPAELAEDFDHRGRKLSASHPKQAGPPQLLPDSFESVAATLRGDG